MVLPDCHHGDGRDADHTTGQNGHEKIDKVPMIYSGAAGLGSRDVRPGDLIAVVDGDNKVDIRTVKVGEQVGTLWIIADGLKPGERVIAEGGDKVRTGMQVNPTPFAATTAVAER